MQFTGKHVAVNPPTPTKFKMQSAMRKISDYFGLFIYQQNPAVANFSTPTDFMWLRTETIFGFKRAM
jgi:hypothetical protein